MCTKKHYGIWFQETIERGNWLQDVNGKIFVTTCEGVARAYQEKNGGEIKIFCDPYIKEETKNYIADIGSQGQYGI